MDFLPSGDVALGKLSDLLSNWMLWGVVIVVIYSIWWYKSPYSAYWISLLVVLSALQVYFYMYRNNFEVSMVAFVIVLIGLALAWLLLAQIRANLIAQMTAANITDENQRRKLLQPVDEWNQIIKELFFFVYIPLAALTYVLATFGHRFKYHLQRNRINIVQDKLKQQKALILQKKKVDYDELMQKALKRKKVLEQKGDVAYDLVPIPPADF